MPEGIPCDDRELLMEYDHEQTFQIYEFTKTLMQKYWTLEIEPELQDKIENGISIKMPIMELYYKPFYFNLKSNIVKIGNRGKSKTYQYTAWLNEIIKRTALIKSVLFTLNKKGMPFQPHTKGIKKNNTLIPTETTKVKSQLYPIEQNEINNLGLKKLYELLLILTNEFPEELEEKLELFEFGNKDKKAHIIDLICEERLDETRAIIKKRDIFRIKHSTYENKTIEWTYLEYLRELQNRKNLAKESLYTLNQEVLCFSSIETS